MVYGIKKFCASLSIKGNETTTIDAINPARKPAKLDQRGLTRSAGRSNSQARNGAASHGTHLTVPPNPSATPAHPGRPLANAASPNTSSAAGNGSYFPYQNGNNNGESA